MVCAWDMLLNISVCIVVLCALHGAFSLLEISRACTKERMEHPRESSERRGRAREKKIERGRNAYERDKNKRSVE